MPFVGPDFIRVDNSFSEPVEGTLIEPVDANALFDDYDSGLTELKVGSAPALFTQTGAGAIPRTVNSKLAESISAADFCTDTTGTVVSTTELQAAIDAVPYAGALYLPYPYLISAGLTRNTPIEIYGNTQTGAGIIMSSSFPTTSDAISITPAGSTTGWRFHDFQISGQGGARGRHGIAINTTTPGATAYDFDIGRMLIQATATGNSIRVNNTESSGGVFTSSFYDNNLESIYFSLIGDTISIRNNSFASQLVSGNASIYVSQATGTGNLQVVGNNASGLNGILIIDSGVAPIVRDNQFESLSGANVYGSMIDIRGSVASVWAPQLMNNQVQIVAGTTGAALVPVTFGVTTNGSIRGGRLSRPSAGNHIVNGASAVATVIGGDIQSVLGSTPQAIPTVLESGLPFYEQLATAFLGNAGGIPYYNTAGRIVTTAGLSTGAAILATTNGAPIGSNVGTDGGLFLSRTGNYPLFATMSQDATITNAGVITVTKTNNVSFGALATVTPGTGVATALAANIGSAGAPVLFNGALGTPSSGTVTNLTGTASININGTVGATTPSTVAATTVTASTSISSVSHNSPGVLSFGSNGSNFAGAINTSQQWVMGSNNAPLTGPILTLNKNTVTPPATGLGTTAQNILNLVGADGVQADVIIQGFGSGFNGAIRYLSASGTAASPTASPTGTTIGANFAYGYYTSGGPAYRPGAGFVFTTTDNWLSTASGARIDLYATPVGATAIAIGASVGAGLMVGTTTDPGAGVISANVSITTPLYKSATAPTAVSGAGPILIGSGSAINSRMKVNLNGTDYWIPVSTTAF